MGEAAQHTQTAFWPSYGARNYPKLSFFQRNSFSHLWLTASVFFRNTEAVKHRKSYTFFNNSFHRFHASSWAFLLAALASGASPARMKPWPAPSYVTGS